VPVRYRQQQVSFCESHTVHLQQVDVKARKSAAQLLDGLVDNLGEIQDFIEFRQQPLVLNVLVQYREDSEATWPGMRLEQRFRFCLDRGARILAMSLLGPLSHRRSTKSECTR
jgi:hypothetical protein